MIWYKLFPRIKKNKLHNWSWCSICCSRMLNDVSTHCVILAWSHTPTHLNKPPTLYFKIKYTSIIKYSNYVGRLNVFGDPCWDNIKIFYYFCCKIIKAEYLIYIKDSFSLLDVKTEETLFMIMRPSISVFLIIFRNALNWL